MAITLLALYRRPDGGDDALETFMERYHAEHLPLVAATPGLRSMTVHRVSHTYTDSDLVLTNHMTFDDREALDAGVASDAMRQAGRNLREIAPGLLTLLVLEEEGPASIPVVDPEAA
ncbi:MAG: hypothetical protein QOH61_377 [Chloroflexota bacterium]|jgi:uncharacterized protein (TIGR02118 family)|nr:hypothetical protein [Chloroflexota bacterium]